MTTTYQQNVMNLLLAQRKRMNELVEEKVARKCSGACIG
jgi:hypothetical protein